MDYFEFNERRESPGSGRFEVIDAPELSMLVSEHEVNEETARNVMLPWFVRLDLIEQADAQSVQPVKRAESDKHKA